MVKQTKGAHSSTLYEKKLIAHDAKRIYDLTYPHIKKKLYSCHDVPNFCSYFV